MCFVIIHQNPPKGLDHFHIHRISPTAIIMAFSDGVTNKWLVGKLETHNVETVFELFALVDKYAQEAEAHTRVERRGAHEETPPRDGPILVPS